MELTKEEIANGWAPEALARYRAEREKASSHAIANRRPKRPDRVHGGVMLHGRVVATRKWHRAYP